MRGYPYIAQLLEIEATKNAKFAGKIRYTTAEMHEIWHGDNDIEDLVLSTIANLDHTLQEHNKTDDMASYHRARFIGKIVDELARYLHGHEDGSDMLQDIIRSYQHKEDMTL